MIARVVHACLVGAGLLSAAAAAGSNVVPTPPKKAPAAADVPAPPALSQPTYRRYVHPHAKLLAGVELSRMAASPLGRRLAAQIEGFGLKKRAAAEGMDFVSDIEKLVLSSPGEPGVKGEGVTLSEEAPFVVSMQGKFKIDKLRRSLMARKATHMVHQSAEVWLPATGDTSLAIVNSQVILLGDRKSLRATLDAQAEGAAGAPGEDDEEPVSKRAAELAKMYDVWLVSEASLSGLGAAPVPQAELLSGIDRVELGVSLRQGLVADVNLHGRTPEDTSKIGTMLAGLKGLAAMTMQGKKEPELAGLLDKLKIGTSGDSVMVSVQFSQKDLDKGFDSVMASRMGAGGNSKRPPVVSIEAAAKPAAAPQPPPAPLMVRIFNADGGTREIPLQR